MIRETVDARLVFLRRRGDDWIVVWGRTEIANHTDWRAAVREILDLFGVRA